MKPAAALAACGLLAACASVGPSVAPPPVEGYVGPALEAFAAGFTPQPHAYGSDRDRAALELIPAGSDRWWLATAQAELRPPEAAQHFDCLLGARLTERPRPALTRVMGRLLADSDAVTRQLSTTHPRPRPVALWRDLRPCQRVTDAMRDSPSWPAGGAVAGAAYGALFADLAPDQAEAARRRGRDLGDSRVVCRMNWTSDVDDGERIGQALYQQVSALPEYRQELEAARAEVAAARAEGLTNPSCAAERRALAVRPDAG